MLQVIMQLECKTFKTHYIGIYSPLNLLKRRRKIYWLKETRWR
jgi:hypothetical protein